MRAKKLAEFDKIKALILLKKQERGYTYQDLAGMAGITRQTFARMMIGKATDEWPLGAILSICSALEISGAALWDAIDYERRNE